MLRNLWAIDTAFETYVVLTRPDPAVRLPAVSLMGNESSSDHAVGDWALLRAELDWLAEEWLGARSQRVRDELHKAEPSAAGMRKAIDAISKMTIAFVDPVKIDDLAFAMETRLAERTGLELPPRRPYLRRFMHLDSGTPILACGSLIAVAFAILAITAIASFALLTG